MKKARTPLAIWLALILTLTLFPTALAEPTEPSTTPQMATITFDNGDAPDDVTVPSLIEKEIGSKYHIAEGTVPGTWEGHTFLGWVSSANPGKLLQPGDNIAKVPEGGLTLTAQWEETKAPDDGTDPNADPDEDGKDETPSLPIANELTITWDSSSDAATGIPQGSSTTENQQLTIPANPIPTLEGHTFIGYYDANGADEPRYCQPGQTYTFSDNTTLTASFQRNYTFAFAGLEGISSAQPSLNPDAPGTTIKLPDAPTKAGSVFDKWQINNTAYEAGASYTLPKDVPSQGNEQITVTATWKETPKIAINYDRGNAPANASMPTGTSVEKAANGATSFTLDKKTPSRNDNSMVFDYYTANVDLGDPDGKYAPGQTVSIPEGTTSVTLTAHWYKKYYADDGNDDRPSKPSKPTYDEYRIRATCSDGGWVSPAGSSYVREGRNLTVTFAPYKGYAIDGVYIDGVLDNRFDGSYTFRDVDENHTIYVRYVRDSGSSGGSSGGGSHWDDDTSPKTGDTSAPLSMGLGVGSLALIAFLVARKMRRA